MSAAKFDELCRAIGRALLGRVASMERLGHTTVKGASHYWHDLPDADPMTAAGDGMFREFALLVTGQLERGRQRMLIETCAEIWEPIVSERGHRG